MGAKGGWTPGGCVWQGCCLQEGHAALCGHAGPAPVMLCSWACEQGHRVLGGQVGLAWVPLSPGSSKRRCLWAGTSLPSTLERTLHSVHLPAAQEEGELASHTRENVTMNSSKGASSIDREARRIKVWSSKGAGMSTHGREGLSTNEGEGVRTKQREGVLTTLFEPLDPATPEASTTTHESSGHISQ